jgi:serine/threonine protein kinase
MAALTPVASVEALVSAIEKSSLLSADALTHVRTVAERHTDPKLLAKELIKDGTLTRWQSDQLIHGYHRLVIGRYKLLDQLRTTPTGRLYLAEHLQMGRRHTLKVLARRLANNPKAVQRFLIAAQNACRLDHRNVSHVYDVNQDRIGHYVVMEHVEGQDLEQIVERTGCIKLPDALAFIAQAAEGLAYAHGKGVVHGDLKPANLLRDHSGCIKILEIGQDGAGARPETVNPDESVEMASLAAVIFQAPEMRGDGETADIPCDVYSLGSILCYLLTGKAAADAVAAAKHLQAVPDIQPDAVAFCCGLMATKPAERPESMDEVLATCIELHQQLTAAQTVAPEPEKLSRPAAAPPRAKLPPVAKQLDDTPATPARSASGGSIQTRSVSEGAGSAVISTVEEPSATIPIVIDTHGGPAKRAGGSSGKTAKPKAASKSAAKAIRTPLILAGAIGGGAALVLVMAVILALRNLPSPAQTTLPKTADSSAATTTSAPPAANPAAAASTGDQPVTTPALPAESKSDSAPPPEKAPPEAAPPPETAADSATPQSSPEVGGEPTSIVQPAAPGRRSARQPKSKIALNPFAGFPVAVSLPELPEPNESLLSDTFTPLALGPCIAGDNAELKIQLLGGDTAIRAGRHKFELLAAEENKRRWNVQLTGNAQPLTVASLAAENEKLMFQWAEDAHKQSPLARNLANCALALGSSKQVTALRTAITGAPLVVDIEKAGAATRWNIGHLPIAKQLFIEVIGVEGFSKLRQDPKEPVAVSDIITLGTGPGDGSPCLWFRLQTSSTASAIDVRLQPTVKLRGWAEPRPYLRKDLLSLQPVASQEIARLTNELQEAKKQSPRSEPAKELRRRTIERLENELLSAATFGDQLKYILEFMTSTDGEAKIHFRVYSQLGDTKIDLVRTAAPDNLK